jgi:hypothetical protein
MSTLAQSLHTARYERQIVKAFRRRRAISGAAAQRLRDLGLKDSQTLRDLIGETIVRKAGPERFFLHEAAWAARDHMSWRTVGLLGAMTGLLCVATALYLLLR